MVITKEELLKKVSEIIGDRNDDDAISIIEDVSDTLTDYETRMADATNSDLVEEYEKKLKESEENWRRKYNDNDVMWREKYKARFFESLPDEHVEDISEQLLGQTDSDMTFDALFKEE